MQREKLGFLKKSGIIFLSALASFGLEERVKAYSNTNQNMLRSDYSASIYNQDFVIYEDRNSLDILYIPEPTTVALLGLGSLALLRWRHKRGVKKSYNYSLEPATSVLLEKGGLSLSHSREEKEKKLGKEKL